MQLKRHSQLKMWRFIPILLLLMTLCACGGGGGADATSEPPPQNNSNWDSLVWDQDNWG